MQPEEFADLVVVTVKAALAPVLERLAAAEARLTMLPITEKALTEIRERVLVFETKAAILMSPSLLAGVPVPETPPVDLAPVLERLSAAEARQADLKDRLLVVETKASMPLPVLESTPPIVDLSPVLERVARLDAALTDATKDVGALRERMAVAEVRQLVPGPSGKDGVNGKDGADGLGWDDLSVEHDGERAFTFKMTRGDRVRDVGTFTVPVQIYRGIYTEGKTYEPGDTVTYARALWHCQKTTVLKPDATGSRDPVTGEPRGGQGKDFWKMAVKGGTDGKDGRDPQPVTPVVRTQ